MGAGNLIPLIVLVWAVVACAGLEVVTLDASSFEHQTQAATGQTTGHWLVLFDAFAAGGAPTPLEAAWDALAADAEELEHPAVFAKVDVGASPEVQRRFAIGGTPAVILFRDRMMYRWPGQLPASAELAALQARGFLSGGWHEADGEAVPPESAGRRRSSGGGSGKAAAGAAAPRSSGGAGASGEVGAALAALAGRLSESAARSAGVLRLAGAAAAVLLVVMVAAASYLGISLNFDASGNVRTRAPAPAQPAPAPAPAGGGSTGGGGPPERSSSSMSHAERATGKFMREAPLARRVRHVFND